MSTRVLDALRTARGELRHEPIDRRLRATAGGETVVDTRRPLLVWEPRRVVPSYAVPEEDVAAELVPADGDDGAGEDAPPALHPGIPFRVHSAPGTSLDVRVGGRTLAAAAFRPDDAALAGYVILDFAAFDGWTEEEEPMTGHPRDPLHRIDVLRSSRHVRVEVDGRVLAETTRPVLLFETTLPTRFYLPREDVRVPLRPSAKRTTCAYKGDATYWTPEPGGDGLDDLVWSYEDPRTEVAGIRGLVSFFNERVDLIVDGEPYERPVTQWSPRRPAASAG